MKAEHKEAIEHIISVFKASDGKVYTDYYVTLIEDYNLQLTVTKMLTEELDYIEKVNSQFYRLKIKGWEFTSYKEIEEKELAKTKAVSEKEKLEIDLAKSNIEANILNKKVAESNFRSERFNKKMSILNFIFIICNFCILIWQIIASVK